MMSVKGKKEEDYVAVTVTDFGQPGRRTALGRHYTLAAAGRQYARIWNVYHRLHGHKVWLEEVVDGVPKGGPMTDGSLETRKEVRERFQRNLQSLAKPT